ncbi:hypothetical protein [Natrinema salaciae]|uniref:Uncharacterized protein n=1 Tax=Natrinema salaciae TaxID=1186196 RepID=A0A1H9JF88_9EURY|nr:hypothetical protein [Natrinema salaciae]SEQ85225.1 hypothetical protein SAMN04489841_2524 [Natrinema salaciae]
MNRRRLLRVSGGALAIMGGLAGCLGDDSGGLAGYLGDDSDGPPPREAKVFEDVEIADGTMEIDLRSKPEVESTVDNVDESAIVGSLLPVGTARAGSRSSGTSSGPSGATGRGTGGHSTAPTGRHGWAIYGGHTHNNWRDDHETETYRAVVATLGVAYMGSNSEYRGESPGPGPVSWDEEWTDPEPGTTLEVDLATLPSDTEGDADSPSGNETVPESDSPSGNETAVDSDFSSGNETDADAGTEPGTETTADEGWYRVGTHLESPGGDTDFEWQAVDFKLDRGSTDGLTIDEAWHVRPRL